MIAPPPYGITVELEDLDPTEPDRTHRELRMGPVLAPQDAERYTRAEVAALYKWTAGIVARMRIALDYTLERQREKHGCDTAWQREQHGIMCGHIFAEFVDDPLSIVGSDLEQPHVCFYVPTHRAEKWVAHVEARLVKMLAADAGPITEAEPQPKHSSVIPDTRQALPQGADNA